jgi:hypothetical protein
MGIYRYDGQCTIICTAFSRGMFQEAGEVTDRPCAEVVGSLMFLMTCTRPELAQSVGAVSRFVGMAHAKLAGNRNHGTNVFETFAAKGCTDDGTLAIIPIYIPILG